MCKTTNKTALPCKHAWAEILVPCAPGRGFDTCPVFFDEFNSGLVIKETKDYNPLKVHFVDSRDSCPFCLLYHSSSSSSSPSSGSTSSRSFSGASLVHPPPTGEIVHRHGHRHRHIHSHRQNQVITGSQFLDSIIHGPANLLPPPYRSGSGSGGIAVYAGSGTYLHADNGVVNFIQDPMYNRGNNGNGNDCVVYVPGTATAAAAGAGIPLGIDSNRFRLIKESKRGVKIGTGARKEDFGVEIGGLRGLSCGCVVL